MPHASSFAELTGHVLSGQLARPAYLTRDLVEWSDELVAAAVQHGADRAPVIDATMIYDTYVERDRIALYEDHPCIQPPWDDAWVCYHNSYGNLVATLVIAVDGEPNSWHDGSIDVARTMVLLSFAGGDSNGKPMRSFGPHGLYRIAIDADGTPLDLVWTELDGGEHDDTKPEWPLITVLGAYTLLNCANIEIVPKRLDRAERRRRQRAGIGDLVESTINIRSTVRRSVGGAAPTDGAPSSTRLHSVRGHVAHYGACCSTHEPRGLLFGRLTGRVWVPQHARGVAALGQTHQTYVIKE